MSLGLGLTIPDIALQSGELVFSTESTQFFSRITITDTARKQLYAEVVDMLVAGDVWDDLDVLNLRPAHSEEAALENLKADQDHTIKLGLPTFTVDRGFTYADGKGLNFLYDPGANVRNYVRDDAFFLSWGDHIPPTTGILLRSFTGELWEIYPAYTDDKSYYTMNNASVEIGDASGDTLYSHGPRLLNRYQGADFEVYSGTTKLKKITLASEAMLSNDGYEGDFGGGSPPYPGKIFAFAAGKSLTPAKIKVLIRAIAHFVERVFSLHLVDNLERADTANGTIGNGWTLQTYSAGLIPATNGRIEGHRVVRDAGNTLYISRQMNSNVNWMKATVNWDSGTGAQPTTAAFLMSQDSDIIVNCIHVQVTRIGVRIGYILAGVFHINESLFDFPELLATDTDHIITVNADGARVTVTVNGTPYVGYNINYGRLYGPYPCFELYSGSVDEVDKVRLGSMEVGLRYGEDAGESTYEGPGDIVPRALAWYGLRGYARESLGKPAVRLRETAGDTEQDFYITGDGGLDLDAIETFAGNAALTIVTLYDQTGNGYHVGAASAPEQPDFILRGANGKPVIQWNINGTTNLTVTPVPGHAQPHTMNMVGNFRNVAGYMEPTYRGLTPNVKMGVESGLENFYMYQGAVYAPIRMTREAWHSCTAVANGASSDQNVDGIPDSLLLGTSVAVQAGYIIIGGGGGLGSPMEGFSTEHGYWDVGFSSEESFELHRNQREYYGFNKYPSWDDQARIAAYTSLSNSNKSITHTDAGHHVSRATAPIEGKSYFEIAFNVVGAGTYSTGLDLVNENYEPRVNTDPAGVANQGLGWFRNGEVYLNNIVVANIGTIANGDRARIAVDRTAEKLWIAVGAGLWNLDASADPATGVGGISISSIPGNMLFPAAYSEIIGNVHTIHTGEELAYPTPTGFTEWGTDDLSATTAWPTVPTTLDDSPIGPHSTLSEGNLVATCILANGGNTVRGTIAKTSGKYYCEARVRIYNGPDGVGFCNASHALTSGNYLGINTDSLGWYSTGSLYYNGGVIGAIRYWTGVDYVLCMALDLDAARCWFKVEDLLWNNDAAQAPNGTGLLGIPTIGTGLFPAFDQETLGNQMEINFGGDPSKPFLYPVPSGYRNWV